MSNPVIHVENVSKEYHLGTIGHGTFRQDIQSWWARQRGKEDPNAKIGISTSESNDKNGSFWVLKNVSFNVEQGEVLGMKKREIDAKYDEIVTLVEIENYR